MGLKIWDTEDGAPPARTEPTGFDVVGRFRAGYQAGTKGVALSEYFVTTGDPDVAKRIEELLGSKEDEGVIDYAEDDNAYGVFTPVSEIDIIIPTPKALRSRMVRWVNGKLLWVSDGETISWPEDRAGEPSPQAGLSLQDRKQAARDEVGEKPETSILFYLAADENLGQFRFQSGSWDLAGDIVYFNTEEELATIDGPAHCTLTLEEVSFTAKKGPRAGKVVTYTKPVLKVNGPAKDESTD